MSEELAESKRGVISLKIFDKPKEIKFKDLNALADAYIGSVVNGEEYALEFYAKLRCLENFAERVRKGIETEAINDFHRNLEGKKTEVNYGMYVISTTTTGTKYDYSHDPTWMSLQQKIEEIEREQIAPLKEAQKQREEFLKSLAKNPSIVPVEEVDEDSGEIFIPRPALQIGGKETLRFTPLRKT